jgi:hypothetical protein
MFLKNTNRPNLKRFDLKIFFEFEKIQKHFDSFIELRSFNNLKNAKMAKFQQKKYSKKMVGNLWYFRFDFYLPI